MLDEYIPVAENEKCVHDTALQNPYHPLYNDSSDENSGIFGLSTHINNVSTVIVPAPWDAACSQGTGTRQAPELILEQSRFVELHDLVLGNIYERGIVLADTNSEITVLTEEAATLENDASTAKVDQLCQRVNSVIEQEIVSHLSLNRSVGLLGGDHSISYGSVMAHKKVFPAMGLLQIDAHADLRPSLDGLTWSHASVLHRIMETIPTLLLTQVGIRAVCSIEQAYKSANNYRINQHTDYEIQRKLAQGVTWQAICDSVINHLPAELYLTLDIDGLEPSCCPNTGTPVPGGLSYNQLTYFLHRIVSSGRIIRGFDLVEVGGNPKDALIAAHLLYFLCGLVERRN